jgi:hypothetical protein
LEIAMPSLVRVLMRAILRPVAWVAYWLSEVLWEYHPPHTSLQLKDAAAAAGAFLVLDMDEIWAMDPAWKDEELPYQIRATLGSFSRKEWEELKGMVAAEVSFLNSDLESGFLRHFYGDLQHLRRKTP